MKKLYYLLSVLVLASKSLATTWYVDNTATGTHNGTSWANAWTALSQISGLSAGDTVYISGGASGGSQTYSVSSWKPTGGTASALTTYQIGQDAAHNGTVIFSGTGTWFGGANNAVISGDAGDGAMHFVCSGYTMAASVNGDSNLRISYVNFGNTLSSGVEGQGVNNLELDHFYAYVSDPASDHFVSVGVNGTTWDNSRFHDFTIYCPHLSSNANGADFFQLGGNGFSIYNGLFIGYSMSYTGGQHQDGWQGLGNSYVKIYNNVFYNIQNYSIFGDAYYSGFSHIRAYDNVFINCTGTCFGTDGGYNGTLPCTFNDVVIANNLMDHDDPTSAPWALNNVTSFSTVFTGCVVANNTVINGKSISLQGNLTSTVVDNAVLTRTQAAADYVSYSAGTTNSNFHLLPTATALIGQGMNLLTYFTTDMDGDLLAITGNWDIGPYAFTANAPVIQVNPGSVSYGTVPVGSSVTNSIMVKNIGTGTLSGSAAVAAPFNVISGGNYSLSAGQTQAVVVIFSPVTASNYSQTVSFSGGGGTNVTVSANVTNSPAPPPPTIVTEKVTASTTNPVTLQFCTNLLSAAWWTAGTFAGSTNLSFTNLPVVFIRGICSNVTSSVTLSWAPSTSTSTTGYKVNYGTTSGTYTSTLSVGKVTTATIPNLKAGQRYYFRVDAYNFLGMTTPYTSETSATAPATSFTLRISH